MIYDIAGIGIGPANLGLAALLQPIKELKTIFFEKNPAFSWHPGLMIEGASLQVPFYADLVTLADPSSKFNFLAFLKSKNRLIQFGIYDSVYISRALYNSYCNWVVSQLDNLHFNQKVDFVLYNGGRHCYEIHFSDDARLKMVYAKRIVSAIGSVPFLPPLAQGVGNQDILHSSDYLYYKEKLLQKDSVTLVGSGQSAGEIFLDLLRYVPDHFPQGLSWMTKANRYFPMEPSKLSHEMTSPDYISYFYRLPANTKAKVLQGQDMLYKGMNQGLINRIYDRLYELSEANGDLKVKLSCSMKLCGLERKEGSLMLWFHHLEQDKFTEHATDTVILATGYRAAPQQFLHPIRSRLGVSSAGEFIINENYSIDKKGEEIFLQNAELLSHGFNAADLGLCAFRNSVIINAILGYDYYLTEKKVAFQDFGV